MYNTHFLLSNVIVIIGYDLWRPTKNRFFPLIPVTCSIILFVIWKIFIIHVTRLYTTVYAIQIEIDSVIIKDLFTKPCKVNYSAECSSLVIICIYTCGSSEYIMKIIFSEKTSSAIIFSAEHKVRITMLCIYKAALKVLTIYTLSLFYIQYTV